MFIKKNMLLKGQKTIVMEFIILRIRNGITADMQLHEETFGAIVLCS